MIFKKVFSKAKYIIIIFIIVFIFSACGTQIDLCQLSDNFQGNTNGNIISGEGIAVEDNENLYYADYYTDNQGNLTISNNEKDKTKLSNLSFVNNINLISNYIYYLNGAPGFVYRYDTNTKKNIKLVNYRII